MSDIFDEAAGDVFDQAAAVGDVFDQAAGGGDGRLLRAGKNVVAGAVEALGAGIEGVALAPTLSEEMQGAAKWLLGDRMPESLTLPPSPPKSGGKLYEIGQKVRQAGEGLRGEMPAGAGGLERFTTETLPRAAGSMVSTVASAVALRRAGVRSGPAVAVSGAAPGAGDAYLDAIEHGADEETAMFSALTGAGLGSTEAVPIAKWLSRVGGTRAFSTALREGGEEALQEFFQQVGSNIVADQYYDPERPWLRGAWEGAGAGATLGFLGSLLASSVGKVRARRGGQSPASSTPKAPEPPPEADLRFDQAAEEVMLPQAPAVADLETGPIAGVDEALARAGASDAPIDFSPFDMAAGAVTEEPSLDPEGAEVPAVVETEPQPAAGSLEVAGDPPLDLTPVVPPAEQTLAPSPASEPEAGLGAGAAVVSPSDTLPTTAPAEPTVSTEQEPEQATVKESSTVAPEPVAVAPFKTVFHAVRTRVLDRSDVANALRQEDAPALATLERAVKEELGRLAPEVVRWPGQAMAPFGVKTWAADYDDNAGNPGRVAKAILKIDREGSRENPKKRTTKTPLTAPKTEPTVEAPSDETRPDGLGGLSRTGGEPGPALDRAPAVDVRESAGPGAGVAPVQAAGPVPGQEVPGGADVADATPGPGSGPGDGDRSDVRGGAGAGGGPGGDGDRATAGGGAAPDRGQPVARKSRRGARASTAPAVEPPAAGEPVRASEEPVRASTEEVRASEQPPAPKELAPEDRNHVLPQDEDWIPTGDKAKARANLEAIRLLKRLEAESRNPTPEEKAVLARYVGWGGLKAVFDHGKASYRQRPPYNDVQRKEFENWEKAWGKLYDEAKGLLTEEEYAAASRSILNAHYTSRVVVKALWDLAGRLGFKGGRALETSAGVGNFIGLAPEGVRESTRWDAVELDGVSARMLAKLYPQARVQQTGFETARLPANGVDLVIGNFPFDKDGPRDPRYPNLSLHNYFFARSVDLVKPGGLVVAITSDSTMDAPVSRAAREYLAGRADLVGAIRLPNTAFKANAGTEVTTDILVFRKRDGTPFTGQAFVGTEETQTYDARPIEINEYFVAHPEMLLGRLSLEGTQYGRDDQRALLPRPGQDLAADLAAAVQRFPSDVLGNQPLPDQRPEAGPISGKVGQLVVRDGKVVVQNADGTVSTPEDWKPAQAKQAIDYIGVRAATQELIALQLNTEATDEAIAAARAALNARYDLYRKRYGPVNARKSAFLDEDVDYPLVLALEDDQTTLVEVPIAAGKRSGRVTIRKVVEWTKGRMFTTRTIFPRVAPARVESIADAYQVSMNFRGRPDVAYMAELTGQPMEVVVRGLVEGGQAYLNPQTGILEPAWVYLSGQVRDKLAAAQVAAVEEPEYQANVAALERVQPAPLRIEQIAVRLGATWVPPEVVARFVREKLRVEARVYFEEKTGGWGVVVESGGREALNTTTHGIHGYTGTDLVSLALNLKTPVVTDEETRISPETGKSYVAQVKNRVKTLEAQEKQNQLKRAFRDWVPTVPEVAQQIEAIYNRQMNGSVAPRYEPPTWSHYPGASADITLRDHQKRVVTRMLQNSTLLAHAVGTGKTYAMITAAMEMRRLGLARKPMIVVQNATLEQFARSFKRLYPTARLLAPSVKQRSAKERNRTMSRIATGDWDCVIVPQSFVNLLPDDPARMAAWIRNQLQELESARIAAVHAEGKNSPRAADIERAKKKLEDKLAGLAGRKVDDVMTFEQLGVDGLFVDEAHEYKKLQFTTQMDSVKGLDTGASQRGLSMFMKVRFVQERNQGRNVIFATGTPVSNTIAEAWTMMRYLRPDVLRTYGMESFDAFAGSFGDTVTQPEMTAGGTWKQVTRFARYVNGPELIAAWRTVADVVTSDELNLPGLPALKNGRTTAVVVKQTPETKRYVARLRAMLEEFEQMKGREKRENSHIPLVVFGLAKKASLDMRMVDRTAEDHPDSKVNQAVQRILETYHESTPVRGTQMVFADLYQDNPDAPSFNLYQELKRKLVEAGIPEGEVVIVDDSVKDAKREVVFDKFNDGDIRIAIGSTGRMGIGINAQKRMVALHHLDAPHRPMDVEQRNGRILRQGNENPVVEVFSYGVENTLDAAMFQKLATKQRFINQILRGEIQGRDFEDAANEISLSFEEQMAAFSGDPLALEKVGIDNQVRELEALRAGHAVQVGRARDELLGLRQRSIPYTERAIVEATDLAKRFGAAFGGDDIRLELEGKTYGDRKAAVEVLNKWAAEFQDSYARRVLESAELPVSRTYTSGFRAFRINGFEVQVAAYVAKVKREDGTPGVERPGLDWKFPEVGRMHQATTGVGILQGIPSDLRAVRERPGELQGDLERMRRNEAELAGFILQPFEREAALDAALKRQAEIVAQIEERTKGNKRSYAEWLLEVPRGTNKPLETQREQARRILTEMERNHAAALDTFRWAAAHKSFYADMGRVPPAEPVWWAERFERVQKRLAAIEAQMLKEAQGAPRVYHMALFPPTPPDPDKQGVRQFMHQVADEPLVSDLAKGKIANAIYQKRNNRDDAAMAVAILTSAGGPEQAIAVWRDPANGIPDMVRTHLGMVIVKRLGVAQIQAHGAGNPQEATRLADVQSSFVDEISERSTGWAQQLQSLRAFAEMTPEGFVQKYRRTVALATAHVRESLGPVLGEAVQGLNAAAQEALPGLAGDAAIQAATTQAINESLAQDPIVQHAIRVQVARSFGSSATVMADVKQRIQRAFEQMTNGRRPTPLWEQYRRAAAAQLARLPKAARERASLDDFTRRLMQALRGQIDGQFPPLPPNAPPRLAPVQQILEAFANPEKYEQVWESTLKELRARYPDDPRVEHLAGLPAALVSPQAMRTLLQDELARADIGMGELIAHGYVAGSGGILKDRIRASLAEAGLDLAEADARGLAEVADREWTKLVEKEQARTAARIQEARVRESRMMRAARSGVVEVADIPETEVESAIRQRLRETRTRLAQVIRGHWRDQIAAGQDLARSMTQGAGLHPVVAQELAHRIEQRFAELLADRKAAVIQRAISQVGRVNRRREVWEALVEASNMGLLSDEDAWRAVAPKLKLPVYSRETAARVMTAAGRVQAAPEGFQRDRAVVDLLDTIKRDVGVSVPSLLMSLWYARLLSGPTTHALNIASNGLQGAMAAAALAARRPGDVPAIADALWTGLVKALPEMQEVVTTGRVTGVRMLKAEPAGALELAPDRGLWRLMRHWRVVARLMAAEDLAVFMPLREMRQVVLAREQARAGGFKGEAFVREVDRILGTEPAVMEEALAQVQTEGLQGRDRARRVNELIEARRPEAIREDALDYALRQTFNGKPYGFLGTVAEHLRPVLAKYPAGRFIVPFVNVVANVTNEAINYAPGANALRLVEAYRTGEVYGRPGQFNDVFELYAKAAAGLVLTSILGTLVVAGWDKDEPEREFDMSGPGPGGAATGQLLATGWRPYSVRIGGAWYSYTETPLAVAFGGLGTYLDAVRYGKLKDRGTLAHVAFAARGMAGVAMNRSMLQGVADLVVALRKQGAERDEAVARSIARPLGSVLSSRLVSQVDRMLDPTARDASSPAAALLSQVPFARRLGRPALNVWGQPIEANPWQRFLAPQVEDPLARTLAERAIWIPMQTEAELSGRRWGTFTADERYRFIEVRGPALRAHLEALLPRIAALPQEQAREMVSRVAEVHTARAKAQVVAERRP